MGEGQPAGPLAGLQAHFGPSPKRGGGPFLKASTSCVLGGHGGHFIIEHSHYYYFIIIILLFLLNLPLLMREGQIKYLSPQMSFSREGSALMLCEAGRKQ